MSRLLSALLLQQTTPALFRRQTFKSHADASDSDGRVSYVEFYENGNLLGTDNSAPYTFDWNQRLPVGHNVTAKAVDTSGIGTISLPVSVWISVLPAQWTHQDMGSVGVAGSVCAGNGFYEIKASGNRYSQPHRFFPFCLSTAFGKWGNHRPRIEPSKHAFQGPKQA